MPPSKQKAHDKFFRETFSQKQIAASYIRQFIDPKILDRLDLSKLKLENTSYTTPVLQQYFSDIVYSCPYGDQMITITFLFEHKSSLVKYPHVQLLRYNLEIWQGNIKNKEPLQIVLPLIFYHGRENWIYRSIPEYFGEVDEHLLRYIPRFDYHLLNIGNWTDDQIIALEEAFLVNALLVFKHIWDEDFILQNIQKLLIYLDQQIETIQGKNLLSSIVVYLFEHSNFDHQNFEDMIDQMDQSLRGEATSTYDQIINYGIEKGIEKGRIETEKEIIRNLYLRGFKVEDISAIVNKETVKVKEIIQEFNEETI